MQHNLGCTYLRRHTSGHSPSVVSKLNMKRTILVLSQANAIASNIRVGYIDSNPKA